jgi:hypothetical protein
VRRRLSETFRSCTISTSPIILSYQMSSRKLRNANTGASESPKEPYLIPSVPRDNCRGVIICSTEFCYYLMSCAMSIFKRMGFLHHSQCSFAMLSQNDSQGGYNVIRGRGNFPPLGQHKSLRLISTAPIPWVFQSSLLCLGSNNTRM